MDKTAQIRLKILSAQPAGWPYHRQNYTAMHMRNSQSMEFGVFSVLRWATAALILSLPVAMPATAQSSGVIGDPEHKWYLEHILRLFEEKAKVQDNAPMASAQRLNILAQIGFWQSAIIDWPIDMMRPTEERLALMSDPASVVPELAVPLADQVAAEVEIVYVAGQACLAAPTTDCLTDVAAAYAAASGTMETAQTRNIRLVFVARLAGDAARTGILQRMLIDELPIFERGLNLKGGDTYGIEYNGLAMRAFRFRIAGFYYEAYQLANLLGRKTRLRPGDPRATFAALLLAEQKWRQGGMSAKDLFAETQYFIDGDEGKVELIEQMVPNLVLYVAAAVEDAATFRARAAGVIAGLPESDEYNTAEMLVVTLGRLGQTDLLSQISEARVNEMLAEPKPADSALKSLAALGYRMLIAAWLGRGDVAEAYRQRVVDLLTDMPPPSLDPKLDEAGQMFIAFAHLAEMQALLDR